MVVRCNMTIPAFLPDAPGFQNPNFPNACGPDDSGIIIYGYTPALSLCIVAIISFFIGGSIHTYYLIRYRTWSFFPIVWGCLMEIGGYIARALASQVDPYSVSYFVTQYFLIVVAPVFFAASIYVCLSHLLLYSLSAVGFQRPWLKRKLILWLFISIDAITTILQVTGAGLVGAAENDDKSPAPGNNTLTGGLAFQTVSFTCYLALFFAFWYSVSNDTEATRRMAHQKTQFLIALLVASTAIYLRTLFRLAESAQGFFNHINTDETLFGILEFAPVAVAVLVLGIWHPSKWIPKTSKGYTRPGDMELGSK